MENQESGIDLKKLWRVLKKYLLWIVICTILGAVAFGVYTMGTSKETYTTTSVFYVSRKGSSETATNNYYDLQTALQDAREVAELITYKDTVKNIMDRAKVGPVDEENPKKYVPFSDAELTELMTRITVSLKNEDTPYIVVTVKYGDPWSAARVSGAFQDQLMGYVDETLQKTNMTISNPQSAPPAFDENGEKNPALENYPADGIPLARNIILGAVIMLVLSYLVFLVIDLMDNTVRGKEELVAHFGSLPVIGSIPEWTSPNLTRRQKKLEAKGRLRDYEDKLLNENSRFSVAEAFRGLRTNVNYLINDKANVVAVTSVKTGECKSVVSCNLAMSYSQLKKKVLLVEGDMRLPSVHEICHINISTGLPEVLAGIESDYHNCLVHLSDHMDVLGVGQVPPNPAELLASDAMKELFAKLREEYDLIVLDLPPVGTVSDAGVVAGIVDQYILSTRANSSSIRGISMILRDMAHMEMKIGGFVISGVVDRSTYAKSPYYYDRYGTRQSKVIVKNDSEQAQ